jgi:hypothetical protein
VHSHHNKPEREKRIPEGGENHNKPEGGENHNNPRGRRELAPCIHTRDDRESSCLAFTPQQA